MTIALSTTAWWTIGYAVAGAVVLVAVALLLTVIALAKRIARQTGDIVAALDGARSHTDALVDVAAVNQTLESIARALKTLRGEEGPQDERGLLRRVADRVLPGRTG